MKKHLFFTLALLLLAAWMLSVPFYAETDGGNTVVYLADGGTGDGMTPEAPVGSLTKAYDALDLSKDCTVVLVGKFTQSANFTRKDTYTGSVTLTSVYGGVDYRESGAVYEFNNNRFYLFGETTFENMHFNTTKGSFLLVVAQHNKVTVGEGVQITGDKTKLHGGAVANAFSILGGCQDGANDAENSLDTDITVLSGSKIYIVAFARGKNGASAYTGTAHIKIGGDAEVSRLHLTGVDRDGVTYGTTEAEITDNAKVGAIYGTTQKITADSFRITWRSGSIGAYEPVCSATKNAALDITDGTVLCAADEVKQSENFAAIAAGFDKVESLGEAAKLEKVSVSAATDKSGVGTIRLIAKLTAADAEVTRYGIFVAKTDAIGTAKVAEWKEVNGTEAAFALDLAEIPQSELDTPIYAWAFVEIGGKQLTLPIAVGESVNAIIGSGERVTE